MSNAAGAQQREGHQRPRSREEFLEKTLELKLKDSRQRKEHFKGHTGKGKVDDLEQNFRVTPGSHSASVLSSGAACGSLGELLSALKFIFPSVEWVTPTSWAL